MKMKIKNLIVGPLLTNCYILISGKEAVVIDPGAGVDEILREIEGKELKYIILTHYHWDHTLGARKLREEKGGKILIHKKEKEFLKFNPDIFLKGEEKIKIGDETLKIIHTPGHTKGSISILGKNFIFTGDVLFQDGIGRTDLPGGSEKDMVKSLKKLEKIIKPGIKIYPGHGESFIKK
jgi:glyoxylase-like metal-dependent hydrolase (beta-lactamase superfamily II)